MPVLDLVRRALGGEVRALTLAALGVGTMADLVVLVAGRGDLAAQLLAVGAARWPVLVLAPEDRAGQARLAVEAGAAAYVPGCWPAPELLAAAAELAQARFRREQRLRQDLEASRRALEERKLIDRAKGILMKSRGLDEAAAYDLLRRSAMAQGQRLAEVARAVVTASGLLG